MSSPNLKHTWQTSIKNDSGAAVMADAPLIIQGNAEVNGSEVVTAGASNVEIDCTVTVAKIVSGFISSTQDVTVHTNATDGTGGQTIALTANKALAWNNASPGMGACPFTPNITKFYVNNAGSKDATVRFGFLLQAP